jgi:ABC-type multidrug transport system fused ATPase/permease subunit
MNLNYDLLNLIKNLWCYIGKKRRSQFYLILILTILAAFAETLSLGALLPFLGVLISPEKVFNSEYINPIALYFGISSPASLVLPLTIFFLSAIIFASLVRIIQLWATTKVTFACGSDLSTRLYSSILHKPYIDLLSLNSSEIISGVMKVDVAVNVLSQMVRMLSSIAILITVMATLIFINKEIALLTIIFFGTFYTLIGMGYRKKIKQNSFEISTNKTKCLKSIQEGIGGIRDIILDKTQRIFCDIYQQADLPLRRAEASNTFIEGIPRLAIEAIGMIFIALLAYWLTVFHGGVESSIPLLGVLAMSAQRLLPALQQAYNAWISILGHKASLAEVIMLMGDPKTIPVETKPQIPSPLQSSIALKNISFKYAERLDWAIKDFSMTIQKGKKIGIAGSTGSGKSTLVDILMGLLSPQKGCLIVDGHELNDSDLNVWQSNISHVPQSIYLIEGSILNNIAFGVHKAKVDMSKVIHAAKEAQLHEFVERLEKGYETLVGERGVRLSGGQRQRIGIARALYKNSQILVLDEATSALDNETESLVMNAIQKLDHEKTILMIAHRISTMRYCDIIYVMDKGKIIDSGTFVELSKRSKFFSIPQ